MDVKKLVGNVKEPSFKDKNIIGHLKQLGFKKHRDYVDSGNRTHLYVRHHEPTGTTTWAHIHGRGGPHKLEHTINSTNRTAVREFHNPIQLHNALSHAHREASEQTTQHAEVEVQPGHVSPERARQLLAESPIFGNKKQRSTQHEEISETMQFSVRSFRISKKIHTALAKHGYVDAEYNGEDATSHVYQHPHGHETWVSAGNEWTHAAHDPKKKLDYGGPAGKQTDGIGHEALVKHLAAFHAAPERKHDKVVNKKPGAGYGYGGDYDNPHHVRDILKRTPSSQHD